jgi:hypothetical protein
MIVPAPIAPRINPDLLTNAEQIQYQGHLRREEALRDKGCGCQARAKGNSSLPDLRASWRPLATRRSIN